MSIRLRLHAAVGAVAVDGVAGAGTFGLAPVTDADGVKPTASVAAKRHVPSHSRDFRQDIRLRTGNMGAVE